MRTNGHRRRLIDSRTLGIAAVAAGALFAGCDRPPSQEPPQSDVRMGSGAGGWREAATAPRSTVPLGVDPDSWAHARRLLYEKQLPEPETVRAESFLNALSYALPESGTEGFGVQLEVSPSPWNAPTHLVRIALRARHVARPPAHLTVLVDTSGSHQRSAQVKRAVARILEATAEADTVALVSTGTLGVVLPPTPAHEAGRILGAVDTLVYGGPPALGEGLALASRIADGTHRTSHTSRVLVVSHGDADGGITERDTVTEGIRSQAGRGIGLLTLGLGSGPDDRMQQLANAGDGRFFPLASPEDAGGIVAAELAATREFVADDVTLEVDWNPEAVGRYRLMGYDAPGDGDPDGAEQARVRADQAFTALYVVELAPEGVDRLGTVRLRATVAGAGPTEQTFDLSRSAMRWGFDTSSPDHRMALAAAAFAERLRGSPYAAVVPYTRIQGIATLAARPDRRQDAELVDLVRRASQLAGEDPCRPLTLVSGGEKRIIMVDEQGIPCR